jgi:hypothetical protein
MIYFAIPFIIYALYDNLATQQPGLLKEVVIDDMNSTSHW